MNRSFLLLLAAAFLAGCATYAPYDYGLELQVIQMDEHLHGLLGATRSRPLAPGEGQAFLHDSLETLQLLHDRAFAHHEQSEESALVEYLRHRMQLLAVRKAPLTRTDLRRLAFPIGDLREMETRRSNDYRQVPLVNLNAYDFGVYGDYDGYAYRHGYYCDRDAHHSGEHHGHH